jgi:hypothetical protein
MKDEKEIVEPDKVEAFVDQLMADSKVNNPLIPDAVESVIYNYVIKGAILATNLSLGWVLTKVVRGVMRS